eukprot:3087618-Rhodomonas_salina.1
MSDMALRRTVGDDGARKVAELIAKTALPGTELKPRYRLGRAPLSPSATSAICPVLGVDVLYGALRCPATHTDLAYGGTSRRVYRTTPYNANTSVCTRGCVTHALTLHTRGYTGQERVWIAEIHLSHNNITVDGALALFQSTLHLYWQMRLVLVYSPRCTGLFCSSFCSTLLPGPFHFTNRTTKVHDVQY